MKPGVIATVCVLLFRTIAPAAPASGGLRSEEQFAEFFKSETANLEQHCLTETSLEQWKEHQGEYRRQLLEMLGLWPLPEKTDLKPVVTGKIEREDFTVEKLQFQAMPRLYVTGNLYVPKKLEKPAPAILYVCGHSRVFTNGASCGNKAAYQHHGIWFARNGYVCLVIDTLQLGEIEGLHHGTYREGQWWWNSKGYTPAGVEAWFGVRALDYLASRLEVDKERMGMTGRSGGGSYTWTVAAIDERVRVAAPVAGITDLQNQVVDRVVEGHCDCMFFLNAHRWDFPQVAALVAPRPLLIANSDKDSIFPLDGVIRLHKATKRIYELYGQTNHLGLLITDGPHSDTQDLQVPVFRWFNRFLKGEQPLIEMAAKPLFSPEELKVFDKLPEDELNTKIAEHFVHAEPVKEFGQEVLRSSLREKVFRGWPESCKPRVEQLAEANEGGVRRRSFHIESQPGIELFLCVVQEAGQNKAEELLLTVLDEEQWTNSSAKFLWEGGDSAQGAGSLLQEIRTKKAALVYLAPRGVERHGAYPSAAKLTQIRRRYMLLGDTLDSMRVWDIRAAVVALDSMAEFKRAKLVIRAQGTMAVNAAYAGLFESRIAELQLAQMPRTQKEGPDYLNVLKIADTPQVLRCLGERAQISKPIVEASRP